MARRLSSDLTAEEFKSISARSTTLFSTYERLHEEKEEVVVVETPNGNDTSLKETNMSASNGDSNGNSNGDAESVDVDIEDNGHSLESKILPEYWEEDWWD